MELIKIEIKFFWKQLTGLTTIYFQYSSSPFSLHTCILKIVIAAKFLQLNFENEEYMLKRQISAERPDCALRIKASLDSLPIKLVKAQMEKEKNGQKRMKHVACILET